MLVNPTLLMAKAAFYQHAPQQGRDLMSKARALAIKTLKNEEFEAYLTFLVDFLTMSLEFCAQEAFEIDALLVLHKEMEYVKAQIDKRGKLFDGYSDDKFSRFATIKYELLKRTKRTKETYEAGIVSITSTYDHARTTNDNHVPIFDLFQIYALAINEFSYGDLSNAHALWKKGDLAKKELLLKPLDDEQRQTIDMFVSQCDPWGN